MSVNIISDAIYSFINGWIAKTSSIYFIAVFRLGKNVLAYDYKLITTEFVYHKIKQCFVWFLRAD
jgi:hypothetical protein